MTLALMWFENDTVFAVAESAIARKGTGASGETSLGQKGVVDGEVVDEAVLKLFPVGECMVAAGAGDEDRIRLHIQALQAWLRSGTSPREALVRAGKIVTTSMSADLSWEMILGVGDSKGPGIYHWKSQQPDLVQSPQRVFIGAGAAEMAPLIKDSLNNSSKTDPEEKLVELLSGINTIAAWSPWMLTRGMGGAFYGLSITQAGIRWQPDIGYLLLTGCPVRVVGTAVVEPNPDVLERLVTVGVRGDHLFVSTARPGGRPPQIRIIRNSTSKPPDNMLPEWWEKWGSGIEASFKEPDWAVFIRPERSKVVVMRAWALAAISSLEDREHTQAVAMLHLDTEMKGHVDMLWVS